ncbi:MAG TPA: SOS response-associated peptidase [Candidatus Dojkabacteria bacterium]|nr:SOS response-associated peptidase [Candidatus Dojkabacteria bacterium]HRO64849.1 SOS response-associated peptidase [Candidatus Dojkabacteria bacterium]HRP50857.1 SOS response-associated peptidase [Candidatus Dojkabacteria bacterium]
MCGRFHLEPDEDFYPRFKLKHKDDDYPLQPNHNIKPGQIIPTIIHQDKNNKLTGMKWGFVPVWAKDPKIGYKLINSRSETIFEKPSFKHAIKNTRCLIPATGFYEWDEKKNAHLFQLKGVKYFAIAGIFSEWKDPQGEILTTCSIITREANKDVKDVHERMPVILDEESENEWLSNDDIGYIEHVLNKPTDKSLSSRIVTL